MFLYSTTSLLYFRKYIYLSLLIIANTYVTIIATGTLSRTGKGKDKGKYVVKKPGKGKGSNNYKLNNINSNSNKAKAIRAYPE